MMAGGNDGRAVLASSLVTGCNCSFGYVVEGIPLSTKVVGCRFWSFQSGRCRRVHRQPLNPTIGAFMIRVGFCGNTIVRIDSSS